MTHIIIQNNKVLEFINQVGNYLFVSLVLDFLKHQQSIKKCNNHIFKMYKKETLLLSLEIFNRELLNCQ